MEFEAAIHEVPEYTGATPEKRQASPAPVVEVPEF